MKSNIEIQKRCEWCNQLFTAQKMTTKYCSHTCNSRAYKAQKREKAKELYAIETKTQYNIVGINYATVKSIEEAGERYEKIKGKEYLSVSETAFLLSVGRVTIYRYLHNGTLKAFQTNGKTFIRKADIDMIFNESEQYRAHPRKERKPITELYTLSEVKKKYKVKESWIYKIVKEHNIPKTLARGKCYYSKKHIDRYFEKKGFGNMQHIEEWYSVKDIQDKYGLSLQAIYSFASEQNIPRRKEGKNVFYSQKHFDQAKGYTTPEYYTVEEAMQKYNLTRDSLYYQVKFHNIPKIKAGRYIKISKPELDKLFETLIIV
ncbi:MAG: helix-turn-helix domain-containing protein [Tannerella sp.]|jgi:excisionase family DNA binding protein|nr:helix-turn-helix domain-containing protein [Tannerella sp.]